MADRYFINVGSNWNDTANWASSSGGTGGETIPTSADNVFFDANSGNCAVDASSTCLDLDFTGYTGTFSGTSTLNIFGSLTFASGMTRTYTGAIIFWATSTGKTLTFDGITTASTVNFNGTGGGWTLQDAWDNGTSSITLSIGSLDTNGFAVDCGVFSSSSSSTKALTLGASYIRCINWTFTITTNLTFSAGTSTIEIYGASFSGGGLTYNAAILQSTNTGTIALGGTNTFATLTITGPANKTQNYTLSANQTVSGTLTIAGNSLTNRLLIKSNTLGTARTITAATTTLSNCDFQDITGAGAADWDGTSLGDALGNTDITFTTPVTRYAVVAGNWSNTATWSTTSGGSGGASVPLCHDTVILNGSSAAGTYVADMPRLGADITCTGFTRTLTTSTTASVFGSLTLASGMTLTASTQTYTFEGRGTHTLTSAGKSWGKPLRVRSFGGSYTLQDGLTLTGSSTNGWFYIDGGTFSANNFDITAQNILFYQVSAGGVTVNLGSGIWTLTGSGSLWPMGNTSLTTINSGTSIIVLSDGTTSSKTFNGGGKTYHNLTLSGAGVCNYTFTGSNTFNKIESTKTVAHALVFTTGTTTTVADWQVRGTSGNVVTINSTTTGTHTLAKTGGRVTTDYLNIQHSIATPSNTWYAGLNSTNNQADVTAGSGWIFNVPLPTVTTQAVSSISDVQATGNGTVTDTGEGTISERGFVFDTVSHDNPGTTQPIFSGYAFRNIAGGTFGAGAFTYTIGVFDEQTIYYVRACCKNEAGYSYGDEVNFTTNATPLAPTMTTQAVTSRTDTTATGNGTIVATDSTVTRRGFVLSTTPHSNPSDTDPDVSEYELVFDESGTFGAGAFTGSITGLASGVTYYIRSFGENTVGFAYGNELSFITVGVATVTIQNVTNRQSTTATFNGTITNDGDDDCTARGFQYGTTSGVYTETETQNGTFNEGTFSANITGLVQNTTYFVRAYATNAIGTAYSTEIQFSTITFPSTTPIVNLDTNSVTLVNQITTQSAIINQTTNTVTIDNIEL